MNLAIQRYHCVGRQEQKPGGKQIRVRIQGATPGSPLGPGTRSPAPMSLPPQDLSLRVTVAESSSDGRGDNVGHVIIGPSASGMGTTHWNQMLATLRRPVSMWHPIRRN